MLFKHFLEAPYAVPFLPVLSKPVETTTTLWSLLGFSEIGRRLVM